MDFYVKTATVWKDQQQYTTLENSLPILRMLKRWKVFRGLDNLELIE